MYLMLLGLLALICIGHFNQLVPGKVGLFISRNSEAYVALLIVCPWIDWVRPRLLGRSLEWPVAIGAGVILFWAGYALRTAPFPGQIVTLNEALIGCSVVVPYLQQRRPSLVWTSLLVGLSILLPAVLAGRNEFVTDMAEAFGVIVAATLVVSLFDRGLLSGRPVHRARNLSIAAALTVLMVVVHLTTPAEPEGAIENVMFFVQRANEGLVVAIVMLAYYAGRPSMGAGVQRTSRVPVG